MGAFSVFGPLIFALWVESMGINPTPIAVARWSIEIEWAKTVLVTVAATLIGSLSGWGLLGVGFVCCHAVAGGVMHYRATKSETMSEALRRFKSKHRFVGTAKARKLSSMMADMLEDPLEVTVRKQQAEVRAAMAPKPRKGAPGRRKKG